MLASDKVTGYQLAKRELFMFRVVAQLGQSTWFGTKGSWVQIPPARPIYNLMVRYGGKQTPMSVEQKQPFGGYAFSYAQDQQRRFNFVVTNKDLLKLHIQGDNGNSRKQQSPDADRMRGLFRHKRNLSLFKSCLLKSLVPHYQKIKSITRLAIYLILSQN